MDTEQNIPAYREQQPDFSSSWKSPGSIFNLGDRAIRDLFNHPVSVQEKVDGSFFAFGAHRDDDGIIRLRVRSKGAMMYPEAPEKMFTKAVETAKRLFDQGLLKEGWTYRGEYLAKPAHNALAYERVPNGHIILFDVCVGSEDFLPYADVANQAQLLGLEVVPELANGMVTIEQLRDLIDNTTSILGGQLIEGVVIKQLSPLLYAGDKKLLMGKFVSERFRETHKKTWGEANPSTRDIVAEIAMAFCTPARWAKAVQHLREVGKITGTPQDIGPLIKEIPDDVYKESAEDIKDALMKHFWPQIRRKVVSGFPEWYKLELLRQQFEHPEETTDETDTNEN